MENHQNVYYFLEKAQKLLDQENYIEAIKIYQEALTLYPKNATIYRNLGFAQEKVGDTDGEIISYQKAIEFDPQQPIWVYTTLGYLLLQKGEINQLLQYYETGIKIYSEYLSFDLAIKLGDIYYQKENLEKSLKYYQKAREIEPEKIWVQSKIEAIYFQKGINELKQENIETALKFFSHINEINLYNEPEFIPWLKDNNIPWPYTTFNWNYSIEKLKSHEIEWPKISIVTPSFNQGKYIEETILSVLNQNYPNLEYIIIDNQSSDQTQEILKKYENQISKIIIEPDNGQSNAINKGFYYSTGELMTWLNSDDMLAPGALYLAAITYLKKEYDLIAGICIIHENNKIISLRKPKTTSKDFTVEKLAEVGKLWCNGYYFHQPEVIFSRNIWHKIGNSLNEDLEYVMDYELWLKMAQNNAKLTIIDYPFAFYRSHNTQKTSNYQFNTNCMIETLKVRNNFYNLQVNEGSKLLIFHKLNTFFKRINKKTLVIGKHPDIITNNKSKLENIYYTNNIDKINFNDYDAIIILILLKDELSIIEKIKAQGFNKLLIGWFWYNNCQYYQNAIIAEKLDICVPANSFLSDILTNNYSIVTESLPICILLGERPNYDNLKIEPKEGFYIELPPYLTPQINTLVENIKNLYPESLIVREKDEIIPFQRLSYSVSLCLSMAQEIPYRFLTSFIDQQIPILTDEIVELDFILPPELQANLPIIKLTEHDPNDITKTYKKAISLINKNEILSRVISSILEYHLLPKRIDQIMDICYNLCQINLTQNSIPMESRKSLDDYLEKGKNLFTQNKYEEAIALYQEAITFYPDNANLYRELGVVQEKIGDYQGQLYSYQQTLKLESQQPVWVYFVLARLLRETEKFTESISVCQQGLLFYPENENLYRELGINQENIGDIQGEIASYQKAIELNPEQPKWVYGTLAFLLKEKSRWTEAIPVYQKIITLNQEVISHYYQKEAEKYLEENNLKKAVIAYSHAVTLQLEPEWMQEALLTGYNYRPAKENNIHLETEKEPKSLIK